MTEKLCQACNKPIEENRTISFIKYCLRTECTRDRAAENNKKCVEKKKKQEVLNKVVIDLSEQSFKGYDYVNHNRLLLYMKLIDP